MVNFDGQSDVGILFCSVLILISIFINLFLQQQKKRKRGVSFLFRTPVESLLMGCYPCEALLTFTQPNIK